MSYPDGDHNKDAQARYHEDEIKFMQLSDLDELKGKVSECQHNNKLEESMRRNILTCFR